MESKTIENIMRRFNFKGRLASIQYWQYIEDGNKWGLTLEGQPFLTSADHRGLENHRRWCLNYSDVLVTPDTQVDQEWLAGLAVQKGVAYQRTIRDRDQFWGQLVVPVYRCEGANERFVGVIELATFYRKRNYDADFLRIQNLLKDEKFATKALIIKVEYMEDIVKFPLLSFGIEYLWENLTERLKRAGVNQQAFLIKYVDRGRGIRIQSDEDLRTCIANSSSLVIRMFIESVDLRG